MEKVYFNVKGLDFDQSFTYNWDMENLQIIVGNISMVIPKEVIELNKDEWRGLANTIQDIIQDMEISK